MVALTFLASAVLVASVTWKAPVASVGPVTVPFTAGGAKVFCDPSALMVTPARFLIGLFLASRANTVMVTVDWLSAITLPVGGDSTSDEWTASASPGTKFTATGPKEKSVEPPSEITAPTPLDSATVDDRSVAAAPSLPEVWGPFGEKTPSPATEKLTVYPGVTLSFAS